MASLVVDNLVKAFGSLRAVDQVSFHVAEGEFVTLLGPSGCGKSTTLAAIAGLDRPTGGRIALGEAVFFDGASGAFVPPERRDIGLVFQSYALWPHMTVAENLALPLKLRGIGRAERDQRIRESLDLVEMVPYAGRYPFELSGGQQQRVALARTLVYRPKLLLLDEPLSNLDAKLRERARVWLRQLQERLGLTTIYVTHDQAEALAVSDRIAVLNAGRIVQMDTPERIYEQPADPFVADFIGSSNFLKGARAGADGTSALVRLENGSVLRVPETRIDGAAADLLVAVRPERIELASGGERENLIPVEVETRSYLGSAFQYEVRSGAMRFRIQTARPCEGDRFTVHIPADACRTFAAAS